MQHNSPLQIHVSTRFGTAGVKINRHPDECPVCSKGCAPYFQSGYLIKERWNLNWCLQVVYRCPRIECSSLFIAFFRTHSSPIKHCIYAGMAVPQLINPTFFPEPIKKISPLFCEIYDQALTAENMHLDHICGAGYRKSLEFLIKDYLINIKKIPVAKIRDKYLSCCINEDIDNPKIKNTAKRAAWIGNDETHYKRKWRAKDVQDLKLFIQMALGWIESEIAYKKMMISMPEGKK